MVEIAMDTKASPPFQGLTVALRQQWPIPLAADFFCGRGELVALVGPSGSGKSTILKAIAGLALPQQGKICSGASVWLDTERKIAKPVQERRVGFVFQNYALFPHLSALETVMLPLQGLSLEAKRARAGALLDMVHLSGLEARRPAELSGGQQQRVALARALAREPEVLLLDEPFSAVDQVTRRKLQRELAALRRQLDLPILLVTHDLEEAQALADRMVILHHGETLQAGQPSAIMRAPRNALVARLIDCRNLFHGRVLAHESGLGKSWIGWCGHRLQTKYSDTFAVGADISWMIPSGDILLQSRDPLSGDAAENLISAMVVEYLELGEQVQLVLRPVAGEGTTAPLLFLSLPTRHAHRSNLIAGIEVSVSLLGDSIHLMPPE